jgi:signal transduction histidine kinase
LGLTLVDIGATAPNLAVVGVTLAVVWGSCLRTVPGQPNILKALFLVVSCTVLASDPGAESLFVVCFACADTAVDAPMAQSGLVAAVALVSVIIRAATVGGRFHPLYYFPWPIAYAGCWLGGMFVRSQIMLAAELRSKQDLVASEAAINERRRLAREIHDVIAHSMTVTTLHVSAARLALRDEPPDVSGAIEALAEAEQQGRQSLMDIRRTVGLLGTDAPEESQLAEPLPSATDLDALVRSFADAGQAVTCSVDGDLTALPPTTGLAVYRIVQESLANAAKHAPGAPVDVDVRVCQSLLGPVFGLMGHPVARVDVQVTNGAAAGPPLSHGSGGHGLPGMRERVRAVGGRVKVGPEGAGWRVCARLPVGHTDPVLTA